jgi:hypothetical protein
MRFMITVKGSENAGMPPRELMDGIAQLGMEATRAGVLVETGGLLPSAAGARMRVRGGKIVSTDGPFSEAKEVVGGYAVYEVASLDQAKEWTRRFLDLHVRHWSGWEGEAEIRPVMDPTAFGPGGNGS